MLDLETFRQRIREDLADTAIPGGRILVEIRHAEEWPVRTPSQQEYALRKRNIFFDWQGNMFAVGPRGTPTIVYLHVWEETLYGMKPEKRDFASLMEAAIWVECRRKRLGQGDVWGSRN